MSTRGKYRLAGLVIGAVVDLLINLLAAAIQRQAFADQFSTFSLCVLIGLVALGLVLSHWLGGDVHLSAGTAAAPTRTGAPETVTVTRLRALLSYARLRGKGIHLSDILMVGSRVDIDARE